MDNDKVQSIECLLDTLYDVISGDKGEIRNWKLFKYLFHPRSKLVYYCAVVEGVTRAQYWSPDFYINSIGNKQETELTTGFFKKEIYRKIEVFGKIAQVFSTYAAFSNEKDDKPHSRGINSIQLLYHDNRWWIINVFWDGVGETLDNPIPKKYLP